MFKALLQYVPLGPVILAVLLFVLMPFDEGRSQGAPPHKITYLYFD
jgi:hypothetical protein